jgi:two-component system cell cycle sensor histidine kinase/response regulator CckA
MAIFEEVLAALSEAVIATDARGNILFANAMAARLLRVTADGFAGRTLDQVFSLVDRQTGKPGDNPAERALSASGPLPLIGDQALVMPDSNPLPIVWTARASYGPDAKPRGIVIVFRNPEEMSLTPEELIKANRFESLGLLAGGIAHDFNNLLTTILGGLSLAKDNRDSSKLEDSEKACLAAKGLTKQLLLFAKGGSGAMTVCDSKEILEDAVKIASAGSTAEITVQAQPGTGPVKVDRPQILQVFQNLIVNALQAMPPAPHKARLQIKAPMRGSRPARSPRCPRATTSSSRCATTGAASSPSTLRRSGIPSSRRRSTGRASASRRCCPSSASSGARSASSRSWERAPCSASSFPMADQPVEVQARPAPSLRFGTGRVLFMDDDDHICSLTAAMLESLDYKYDIAKNGEDAVVLYKRYMNIGRPYDAVIMDLTVIGGMGGEDTFNILHDLDKDVRAIVSSGYDNDEMAKQYLDMGFCGYLTKPYRVTDLGKVLKAVLG